MWLEKIGEAEPIEETAAMRWGKRHEPTITAAIPEDYPEYQILPVPPRTVIYDAKNPLLFTTLDRMVRKLEGEPVRLLEGDAELKTARYEGEWDAGVPPHYRAQFQHQLMVSGLKWGIVAVLIGGNDLRIFEIDADLAYQTELRNECEAFWARHVQQRQPPPVSGADLAELRKRFEGEPGREVALPAELAELLQHRVALREELDEGESRVRDIDAAIIHALGDAELGTLGDWRVTFKSVSKKAYSVAASVSRQLRVTQKTSKERKR